MNTDGDHCQGSGHAPRGAAGPAPADGCLSIVEALGARGWCVQEGFLSPQETRTLAAECLRGWRKGEFRHARIGHGPTLQLRPEVRNDHVQWLDPDRLSRAQRGYFERLECLRLALNRQLLLGLFEFEGHFTVYPPNARYQRHLDQFSGVRQRRVSCILYLNDAWTAADGGALRLYLEPQDDGAWLDVLPKGGTLVTFLSDRLEHEVLPAMRERISLTGWFRTRS